MNGDPIAAAVVIGALVVVMRAVWLERKSRQMRDEAKRLGLPDHRMRQP